MTRNLLDRLRTGDSPPLTDRERMQLWALALAGYLHAGEIDLGPTWDQRSEER